MNTTERNKHRLKAIIKKESLRKTILSIFDINAESLVSSSFEYRKEIVASVLRSLKIDMTKHKLIYIEPDNMGDLDCFKDYPSLYNTFKRALLSTFTQEELGFTFMFDSKTLEIINRIKLKAPKWLLNKKVKPIMIALNIDLLLSAVSGPFPTSILWVLVHEVMHNFLHTGDESKVQKATFDFLFDHGYTDAIGLELIGQTFVSISKSGNVDEYNIFEYMFSRLKEKNPNLLLSYLYILIDLLYESDKIKLTFQKKALQELSNMIHSVNPSEDLDIEQFYGELEIL